MEEMILQKTLEKEGETQQLEIPPEGAVFDWIVDPEQETTVTYYFSGGEWWSVGNTQEKANEEAQKRITNAYIKEINKKIEDALSVVDKTLFTKEEKREFECNPRHFFEKDLQINERWATDLEIGLDKEVRRSIKKHIYETKEILDYLDKNPEKFKKTKEYEE